MAAARNALAINPDLLLAQGLYTSANIETHSFLKEIQDIERVTRLQPGNTAAFDMLTYDLLEAGYMQEALEVAEQFVQLDPLSPAAHSRLSQGLRGIGRIDEARESFEAAIELGGDFAAMGRSIDYVLDGKDEEAIVQLEDWFSSAGLPPNVARVIITGGRDSETGAAFLDEQIPLVAGLFPGEQQADARRILDSYYTCFGHYGRQLEIILQADFDESTWTYADEMMFNGNNSRFGGFTAHPKYLEAAELMGLIELWEQRGPPDFCKKLDGNWICE